MTYARQIEVLEGVAADEGDARFTAGRTLGGLGALVCLVVPAAALIAGAVFALGFLVVNGVDAMSADDPEPDVCLRSRVGLIEAAAKHDPDAVAILLARGDDPNRRSDGVSPLSCAVRDNTPRTAARLATMAVLLDGGADPDDGQIGRSPLLVSAVRGDRAAVELLLLAGASPSARVAAEARAAGFDGIARVIANRLDRDP